jgi:uncharacterized membrane protein
VNPVRWFGSILLFTAFTLLAVYLVPSDSPLYIIRYVLSFLFVATMPGYCLVNVLFTKENRLDLVEKVVLSVALSFGVVGIVGLFLGLSPIGLDFTSITVSLSVIVVALAIVAFARKSMELRKLKVQSVEHVDD